MSKVLNLQTMKENVTKGEAISAVSVRCKPVSSVSIVGCM